MQLQRESDRAASGVSSPIEFGQLFLGGGGWRVHLRCYPAIQVKWS